MGVREKFKVCIVAGARPNFMKIAPIMRALNDASDVFDRCLVHTGQHYDQEMSEVFFKQLGIPTPDCYLNAGGGTHAEQTAKVMVAFERAIDQIKPDLVLVVGDVNSTLACALVAKKSGIRVAHVEAGLRSGDWGMPEEVNRIATDAISDLYFVTEASGRENLLAEGKSDAAIHFVGHVMIDNLFFELAQLRAGASVSREIEAIKETYKYYAVVTLHRPANVDHPEVLRQVLSGLSRAALRLPMIFPVHPRTAKRIESLGLILPKSIHLLPPLAYRDLLFLTKDAVAVLTDSGGLQEESTALGVPCLTIRDNTERPVTVVEGSNTLVGSDPERIDREVAAILKNGGKRGQQPALWDGRAAERIVTVLRHQFI